MQKSNKEIQHDEDYDQGIPTFEELYGSQHDEDYDQGIPTFEELYGSQHDSRDSIELLNEHLIENRNKGKSHNESDPISDPLEDLLHGGFTFNGRQIYSPRVGNAELLLKALVSMHNDNAEKLYEIIVNNATGEHEMAFVDFYFTIFNLDDKYQKLLENLPPEFKDTEAYIKDQIIIDYMHVRSCGFTGTLPFSKSDIVWLILTCNERKKDCLPISNNLKDFLINGAMRCIDEENCNLKEKVKPFPVDAPIRNPNGKEKIKLNINYRILYLLKKELNKIEETNPILESDRGQILALENFPRRVDSDSSWWKARENVVGIINEWQLFNKFAATKGQNGIAVQAVIDEYLNRS